MEDPITETDSIRKLKTYVLHGGDVDMVRTLLDQVVDPNFKTQFVHSLITQFYVEISKLIVKHGLDQRQVACIFTDTNSNYIKEVVPHIVNHCKENK